MHLFRPKFLSQLQGPPGYYSSYDFHHVCEVYPDEHNFLDSVILLEDEPNTISEVCLKDDFVTTGHFHNHNDLELLGRIMGQVQRDLFQENQTEEETQEEENIENETSSFCRYFQRGTCNKGSECQFIHDLSAKPLVCKFFTTASGCRYGEMCQFRHVGVTELPSMQDPISEFVEDPPVIDNLLKLLPPSHQESILIFGEDDFSFTWKLSQYYAPEKIVALSANAEEAECRTATRVSILVDQLSNKGAKIIWNMEMWPMCAKDDESVPWNETACVLWTIKREDDEALNKRCQVERVARDSFFFLVESLPFDNAAFRIYKRSGESAFGEPKPVTYVFELLPPSAVIHGDYFWHIQQVLDS